MADETTLGLPDYRDDYAPARAFLQRLAPNARVAIAYHGDADGTGSAAVAACWVRATDRVLACALAPNKGEDLYGETFTSRLLDSKPDCLLVLDTGSRSRPIVPGLPTLVVDHHDRPETGVPVDVYLSGLDEEPTPTAALMTYRLLSPLADIPQTLWYAAVGAMGDLGTDAPFPEIAEAKKQYGQKNLSEVVALVNAAKRASAHDTETSLNVLLAAEKPAQIAKGEVSGADTLQTYREEVQAERTRCAKTAPKFAGEWALLRFSSPCQIHGPVASSWVGRLPKNIVIAANEGYTPGNVHFSVRTKRPDENLLTRLRAFRETVQDPEFGQGHTRATGGVLPAPLFEKFLQQLGF